MTKCCRQCDGSGKTKTVDRENVFAEKEKVCGKCGGSGRENPPSKSGRKGFRRAPNQELDDEELGLEQQADKFLARHGFGRNGR